MLLLFFPKFYLKFSNFLFLRSHFKIEVKLKICFVCLLYKSSFFLLLRKNLFRQKSSHFANWLVLCVCVCFFLLHLRRHWWWYRKLKEEEESEPTNTQLGLWQVKERVYENLIVYFEFLILFFFFFFFFFVHFYFFLCVWNQF